MFQHVVCTLQSKLLFCILLTHSRSLPRVEHLHALVMHAYKAKATPFAPWFSLHDVWSAMPCLSFDCPRNLSEPLGAPKTTCRNAETYRKPRKPLNPRKRNPHLRLTLFGVVLNDSNRKHTPILGVQPNTFDAPNQETVHLVSSGFPQNLLQSKVRSPPRKVLHQCVLKHVLPVHSERAYS